jgi:hypothetical protein
MFEDYCSRCGECCINKPGIPVTKKDIKKWKRLGRSDIIADVRKVKEDFFLNGDRIIRRGERVLPVDENYRCMYSHIDGEGKASCSMKYPLRPQGTPYDKIPLTCTVPPETIRWAADI